jgi:hypothetical protein
LAQEVSNKLRPISGIFTEKSIDEVNEPKLTQMFDTGSQSDVDRLASRRDGHWQC